MKIIKVDNFNSDFISDQLVAENVNEVYGTEITETLNEKYSGERSMVFFRLVSDDYKLFVFNP